jgi:muramidase (phage lysozyme)
MTAANIVGFNADDSLQMNFLSALALGESGSGGSSALFTGVGGSDLSNDPTDQYGFPQWNGLGSSHAAGIFQFQPGTWDTIASEYGLNFANQSDQEAGAWYLAEQTFAANAPGTDGGSLETALQKGDYSAIQTALGTNGAVKAQWTSVGGNAAAPQGLAADIASGTGANLGGSTGTSTAASTTGSSDASSTGGITGSISSLFQRGGLILIGAIIICIALWKLLADNGYVPGPSKVGKALVAA